jgi:hypothetical protein
MVDDFASGRLEIASERAVGEMTEMKADAIPVVRLRAYPPAEVSSPPSSQRRTHARRSASIIQRVCRRHGR